eukprot:SM000143S00752  [mRNA]  locus=s143:321475:323960:+ [translate_table: standard]
MEITVHTPAAQWYAPTAANELEYWGLDYPPLSAYQSLAHGLALAAAEPAAVALGTSRGYESPSRCSCAGRSWRPTWPSSSRLRWPSSPHTTPRGRGASAPGRLRRCSSNPRSSSSITATFRWCTLLARCPTSSPLPAAALSTSIAAAGADAAVRAVWSPAQYNCISLGLSLGAAAAIAARRDVLGSVLFCLSLNHKQMSMYYAPAFFGHLLGRCLQQRRPLLGIVRLGAAVVLTFAVVWAPFLTSPAAAFQVLARLVPLKRGLYEDHVANFWCATSFAVKWKRLLPVPAAARLALIATLAAVLPTTIHQALRPSRRGLVLAMLNSAMGFYLFSFQVHEKSILLPLLPLAMLALEEPILFRLVTPVAVFSMYPLLQRDRLALPYSALQALFQLAMAGACPVEGPSGSEAWLARLLPLSLAGGAVLHAAAVLVPPLPRYPYLHPALMTVYAFAHFALLFVYTNWRQWADLRSGESDKAKQA